MKPLISIVMPSYNQRRFIGESINSILNQDYKRIELIIADGGSKDGTIEYLRQVQKLDSRLTWFSGKDKGPADAVNNALDKTQGTIIGWLNSDDLYTPGAIREVVKAFAINPDKVMIYGHGIHIDKHGNFINYYPSKPPEINFNEFVNGCFICQPSVFFKSTVKFLIGNLNDSLETAFDFEYWLRLFAAFPNRIGFIDRIQAKSRLHDQCITKNQKRKIAIEGIKVLSKYFSHEYDHWIITYLHEQFQSNDKNWEENQLVKHISETIQEVSTQFNVHKLEQLQKQVLFEIKQHYNSN